VLGTDHACGHEPVERRLLYGGGPGRGCPETAEPGETITYHFWVQNCGDVALEGGAQVYDPLFGDEPIWSGSLQPGEVAEFDMTYTLPEDACGNFTNTAHAVGHPPDQPDVEDEDSWTVEVVCAPPAAPAIDVEKYISTDGETWLDADTPAEAPQIPLGNDVYFRFLVQNVGDVPLTNVGLTDSVYDLSGCAVPEELDPGASFECIIGPFAAEEGEHVNTATACGDYEGQTYKDTDRAKYYGYFEPAPSIDLEKYVSLLIDGQTTWEDADEPPGPQRIEGSEASFKFELTNDGNVPPWRTPPSTFPAANSRKSWPPATPSSASRGRSPCPQASTRTPARPSASTTASPTPTRTTPTPSSLTSPPPSG